MYLRIGSYPIARIDKANKNVSMYVDTEIKRAGQCDDSTVFSSKMATALTGPPEPPRVLIAPRKIVVPFGGILSRFAAYSSTGMLFPSKSTCTGFARSVATSIEGVSTPTTLAWRSENRENVTPKRL